MEKELEANYEPKTGFVNGKNVTIKQYVGKDDRCEFVFLRVSVKGATNNKHKANTEVDRIKQYTETQLRAYQVHILQLEQRIAPVATQSSAYSPATSYAYDGELIYSVKPEANVVKVLNVLRQNRIQAKADAMGLIPIC